MALVGRHVPKTTQAETEAGFRLGQAYLHSLGLTSWQEAIVEPRDHRAYLALAGRGEITGRVVGALWWERDRGLEQIEERIAQRAEGPVGRYRPTSVKIMQDGVLENFTGAMLDPYLGSDGRPTENRGISFVDPDGARTGGHPARRRGLPGPLPLHRRPGDPRGARRLAAARAPNGPTDGRHHISHIQVIHPDDLGRFAELGVTANAQPYWACHEAQMDELTIPFLGPERATWQYPFRSLLRSRGASRDGLGLERLHARPAARDGGRGQPGQRHLAGRAARPSCPTSGSPWPRRSTRSRWARPTSSTTTT